jgi:hypothetical protein
LYERLGFVADGETEHHICMYHKAGSGEKNGATVTARDSKRKGDE